MFFQLVSSIKVILLVAKIIQSAYLCVIFIYLEKDFICLTLSVYHNNPLLKMILYYMNEY